MESAVPIRVLLADDHVRVRQVLRDILQTYQNVEIVGEASDGEEAVASTSSLTPAVVVMDIAMPRMDGITATRLIKQQHHQIAVLGLLTEPKHYEVSAIHRAGAFDVLKTGQSSARLIRSNPAGGGSSLTRCQLGRDADDSQGDDNKTTFFEGKAGAGRV